MRQEFGQALNNQLLTQQGFYSFLVFYWKYFYLFLDLSLTTNDYLEDEKFGTILIGLIRVKDEKYLDEIRSKFEQFIFDNIDKTISSYSKDNFQDKSNRTIIKSDQNEESSMNNRYTFPSSINSNSSLFPIWIRLIENLLKSSEQSLNRIEIVCQIIIDSLLKQQENKIPSIKFLLTNLYDTIEERLINIFNQESIRYQILFERLSLDEYAQIVKLIDKFILNLNQYDKKYNSIPFKTFLQTQTSKFLNHFHDERKQRLANTLDNEQWKQVRKFI